MSCDRESPGNGHVLAIVLVLILRFSFFFFLFSTPASWLNKKISEPESKTIAWLALVPKVAFNFVDYAGKNRGQVGLYCRAIF